MSLREENGHWFGESQADLSPKLLDYSKKVGYPIDHFLDVECSCGNREFQVSLDEAQGVAIRKCTQCYLLRPMGDSEDYLDEADPFRAECHCEETIFEITVGVSLYAGTKDVRWLYVGCRCVNCGELGCYADWKNEYIGYQKLLKKM